MASARTRALRLARALGTSERFWINLQPHAVTLEHAGGFLAWLRSGDGPQVVSIERRPAVIAGLSRGWRCR